MPVRKVTVANATMENYVRPADEYSYPNTRKDDSSQGTSSQMFGGNQDNKKVNAARNKRSHPDNIEMDESRKGRDQDKGTGGKYEETEHNQDSLGGYKKTKNNTRPADIDNNKNKSADLEIDPSLPRKLTGCKMFVHVLLFLFLFGNDLADFVSDWLFFADVKIAERGLVYGPPEPAAVWFLLVFSIIGTFTFVFECVNLWWEFFRNNPWLDSDWLSAIVIWIEDIPQIIISLHLALCREEPISVFQLTKAAVVLIGVVIRIIVSSVKYCNKDAVRSHHHIKIKVVIMLGIILEAMCAGAIFFVTQTERSNNGDVAFRVPSTVLEDTYNDQRYFTDVSVYVHYADISDVGQLDPNKNDTIVNWVRLTSVYSVRQADQGTISFKIDYANTGSNTMNLAISEREYDKGNWTLAECYNIDVNTRNISQVSNTTCSQPGFLTNSTGLFIKLQYEKPGALFKKKVFGDIHMSIKRLYNGVCASISEYEDSIEISDSGKIPLAFHYYRTNGTFHQEDIKHLLYRSGSPSFFQNNDHDLIDINVIWKTGWRECDSNGNAAPILDQDLALDCS